jgi:hypothetical protein
MEELDLGLSYLGPGRLTAKLKRDALNTPYQSFALRILIFMVNMIITIGTVPKWVSFSKFYDSIDPPFDPRSYDPPSYPRDL